jgi:hypothetical protein
VKILENELLIKLVTFSKFCISFRMDNKQENIETFTQLIVCTAHANAEQSKLKEFWRIMV